MRTMLLFGLLSISCGGEEPVPRSQPGPIEAVEVPVAENPVEAARCNLADRTLGGLLIERVLERLESGLYHLKHPDPMRGQTFDGDAELRAGLVALHESEPQAALYIDSNAETPPTWATGAYRVATELGITTHLCTHVDGELGFAGPIGVP